MRPCSAGLAGRSAFLPVIGRRTRYIGAEHAYLRDHDVIVVAVIADGDGEA